MRHKKTIPKKLRAVVALRQHGVCICGCGGKLLPGFHMQHDPPWEIRPWDEAEQDTIPPSNDPDHLFGMTPKCHDKQTYHPRGPHTAIDSDRHAIDKNKRLRGEVGQNKPKFVWPSRSMPKRSKEKFEPRVRRIDRGE